MAKKDITPVEQAVPLTVLLHELIAAVVADAVKPKKLSFI